MLIAGVQIIDLTRRLGNRAGGLPFTVVLDREGRLVTTHLGLLSEAQLERLVAAFAGVNGRELRRACSERLDIRPRSAANSRDAASADRRPSAGRRSPASRWPERIERRSGSRSGARDAPGASPRARHARRRRARGNQMDLRKLKKLIDLVQESGIAELEVTEGEERVKIVRSGRARRRSARCRRRVRAVACASTGGCAAPPPRPPPARPPARARRPRRQVADGRHLLPRRPRPTPSPSSRSATRSRPGRRSASSRR